MSKKSLLLIVIQFSSLFYFVLFEQFIANNFLLIIQLFGFLIALWGLIVMKLGNFNIQPEVKQNAKFIKKGPYKIIRNPMYFGLITFFGALIIYNFSVINLLIYLMLCLSLIMKIQMEEVFLKQRFGLAYQQYKKSTYRLFPYVY